MSYSTTVGVDLAKNVIQVSVVSGRGKELSNRSLTRKKFAEFLGKQKPSLVAFESCATRTTGRVPRSGTGTKRASFRRRP